jgi:thioredoxin-like negative regulator of GroEL
MKAARELLEEALVLVPLQPAARLLLADCHAAEGRVALAYDLYRNVAFDAECPWRVLAAAVERLGRLGAAADAVQACQAQVSRDPGHHEAHFAIAFYGRRLGRSAEAVLPHVRQAFELAPEVPLYRITLACLLDACGEQEEARELLREVPMDAVQCRCCLRRMATILQRALTPDRPAAETPPGNGPA